MKKSLVVFFVGFHVCAQSEQSLVDALNVLNKSFSQLNVVLQGKQSVAQPLQEGFLNAPALTGIPWLSQNSQQNIYQLKVLQQNKATIVQEWKKEYKFFAQKNPSSEEVKQVEALIPSTEGANCGYHALKNSIYLLNALVAQNNETRTEQLLNTLQAEPYIALIKNWEPLVKAKRKNNDSSWLNGDDIEYLIKADASQKVAFQSLQPLTQFITVIDSSQWFEPQYEGRGLLKEHVELIENFRASTDFVHAFILNNAQEYVSQGKTSGTSGHWIACVVNKVGTMTQYIVMDSVNSQNRITSNHIAKLIEFLTTKSIVRLKIDTAVLSLLDTVRDAAINMKGENPEYEGRPIDAATRMIDAVSDILDEADKQKFSTDPEFVSIKKELVQSLQLINEKNIGLNEVEQGLLNDILQRLNTNN